MRKLLLSLGFAALAATSALQAETVYFTEDFEWLAAWCEQGGSLYGKGGSAEDAVNPDKYNDYCPQINTPKIEGLTAGDTLVNRGYEFVRVTNNGPTTGECIYLQTNYLKFSKTDYQAGIIFPAISNIPATTSGLTLSFDWCPMRNKSTFDEVSLLVNVINGSDTTTVATLEHGLTELKLQWVHATVDLSNVKFDSTSRIFLRSQQWITTGVHRWFLDNIKVYGSDASGIETTIADENAPAEYYNLQGVRVANPAKGFYVKRQGNKATKVFLQ